MNQLSNFDFRMFDLAKKMANTSNFDSFHVGCVITYKKHVIASGANTHKTHPLQKKYNKQYRNFTKSIKPFVDSAHAEIAALTDISYPIAKDINWKDVRVYIYRICKGKELQMGLARPCPACMAAIKDKDIQHIYYSTDSGFAYENLI